ncbi:MAG: hypothetical protein D6689_19080 [Deltaproteobacteria bacterium]|nr:MAG: hypothetical protein D6689_19080 [Deltaproteobacteria bacterium]
MLAACVVGDPAGAPAGDDDDDVAAPDAGPAGGADAGPGAADAAGSDPDAGPDPRCYTEAVDPEADISDVVAAYGGADWKDDLIEAMSRRHPATAYLLDAQRNDSYFDQFSDPSSWTGMVGWLDTLAHEETHLFNARRAAEVGEAHALYAREDLIFYLPEDRSFARGEIYDDIAPAARDGIYAPTYLTGSQGERGFNALLDELSCYLNELAAVGPVGEYFSGGVSLRDGSVAFLYFVAVYLRVARTEHPDVYEALRQQSVYRDAVATLWLRTQFFLAIADAYPALGVDDGVYRDLLDDPAILDEIAQFTGRRVGASNCEL